MPLKADAPDLTGQQCRSVLARRSLTSGPASVRTAVAIWVTGRWCTRASLIWGAGKRPVRIARRNHWRIGRDHRDLVADFRQGIRVRNVTERAIKHRTDRPWFRHDTWRDDTIWSDNATRRW